MKLRQCPLRGDDEAAGATAYRLAGDCPIVRLSFQALLASSIADPLKVTCFCVEESSVWSDVALFCVCVSCVVVHECHMKCVIFCDLRKVFHSGFSIF